MSDEKKCDDAVELVDMDLPRPGELCTCGRPAITVFVTMKFGRVGYCGIPDGGKEAARRSLK